jgi:hypothetical protein
MSFLSLATLLVSASPGHGQTAGGGGPPPASSSETSKPGKPPGATNQPDTARNARPHERSGMRLMPREPRPSIEERLQRGQMEEAVAQGQVSHRLEELHKGAQEGTP